MSQEFHIGTSGWVYQDWRGRFYPENLPQNNWLQFYSSIFSTVEINNTFYRFPTKEAIKRWTTLVPEHFLFSVKVPRIITHIERLKNTKTLWRRFFSVTQWFEDTLGVVLLQFPATFQYSENTFSRLKKFLDYAIKDNVRLACEFRSLGWESREVQALLKAYNVCQVLASSSKYPKYGQKTANFTYVRMHGPDQLFASKYSLKQLQELKKFVLAQSKQKHFFIYFNNDVQSYATINASQLINLLAR